ncbi:MAG: GAF domain-containing protein [Chloroflexota bacterium]
MDKVEQLKRYGLAVAAVAVTAGLRYLADPAFSGRAVFVAFILPVALAAWAGGLGPGLLATALSVVIASYLFLPATGSPGLESFADFTYALTYIVAAVVVTVLAAGLRSGRQRAEDHAFRAQRLQAVAAALSAELTATAAADAVLLEGIHALGAGRGVITMLDPGGQTLSIVASVGYERDGWDRFSHFPVADQLPVSEAVRLREPIIVHSTEELRRRYPSLGEAIRDGGTAVVLPLLEESGAIGGLYYRFDSVRQFPAEDRDYLLALGRLCASALERARLHDAERRAGARAAFLSQASATLAASLDFEVTVRQVAELAVPAIADYCSVHLLEPDSSIRTLALAGSPERLTVARRYLEIAPPRIGDAAGIGAVIREGQPVLVPELTDEMLSAGIDDPAHLDAARRLGATSFVAVPLALHGRTIGALALTATEAGRVFGPEETTLAEELAARAAMAIENSRLYSALVAREVQQAAVARLGQRALTEPDLEPLFEATVVELAEVLDVEFTKILELQPSGQLRVVAGFGWGPGIVGQAIVSTGPESQAGYTLRSGEPIVVSSLPTETRFRGTRLLLDHGVVSGMTAPIPGGTGHWGVLGIHSRRQRVFTEDDANFMVAVANLLSGAIDRRMRGDQERHAQELNRAFIGIVSHELRTPITTIYGGAKMLRRLAPDDADRAAIAGDVEAEAERLYRLTEDLLVMTRLERHDLEIGTEPVLLSRLLERVVASEGRRWPLAEIALHLPPELEPVVGEENYVEQIARNLIGNASKYAPAGSQIDVVAERLDEEIVVRVLDRGPGIRGEDPDRLFGLFYRAPSTAQQASGAGIGLFVCDQLVRAMGGRLWAQPRDDGGSEFGFALRHYRDEDDPARVVVAPTTASTNGSKPHPHVNGRAPTAEPAAERTASLTER